MKSFRERRAWLVGVISIGVITAAVTFAFSLNSFEVLRGVYTIKADLKDAAGLQIGNEVRVAGVRVGRVTGIDLTSEAARISMEVARDIRLPVETQVEVKLRTILGQKFVDLQMPDAFVNAASGGRDASGFTRGYLNPGDVIPKSQTKVPYEVYLAATEGTATLEKIDKRALRKMIEVLGETVGTSKDELRSVLSDLDVATGVLAEKGPEISTLLHNTERVSGTLAESDQDIDGILREATDVFGVLAERRGTTSTLLEATEDLSNNLGLLIQTSRASVELSVTDLQGILITAESELKTIQRSLEELAIGQRMFGTPVKFGRFIEGHVCAVTSEDTCVPEGSPEDPGLPVEGTQPQNAMRIEHGRGPE